MNNNICFKSKWFEKCIRNYLEIAADDPITEALLAPIKYLYVSTTHDYELTKEYHTNVMCKFPFSGPIQVRLIGKGRCVAFGGEGAA